MRIKLSEKYKEQWDNICNKLITILNLDSNNTFLLCDLDNDLEKQKQIIDMKEDIQNVFACSTISAFRTRDANSAINIMKLAKVWIEKQERPNEFHSHISSFTSFTNIIGKSGKS